MNQPIAGVAPSNLEETTTMLVWPSICTYAPGRLLGNAYAIDAGVSVFTLGNLIALLSIPLALKLYFLRVAPFFGIRYRLSNRRVTVERGIQGTVEKSISFDRFDEIEIEVLPGYEWFKAGDLIFMHEGNETFRLPAVVRPEAFRHVCLKSQRAYSGVKAALALQTA